jgi:hypothetical protein
MRQNQDKVHSPGPQLVPVRFELTHPTAITVCFARTFNEWQPEAKTLHPGGGSRWGKEKALTPGTYEYCLGMDGQWMPVPRAKDYAPNPSDGMNSLLKVRKRA